MLRVVSSGLPALFFCVADRCGTAFLLFSYWTLFRDIRAPCMSRAVHASVMFAATSSKCLNTPGHCDGMWSPLLRFSEYLLRLSKKCCRYLALKI